MNNLLIEKIDDYLLVEGDYDKFMDELRASFNKVNKDKSFVKAKWPEFKAMWKKLSKKEATALFKSAKKFEEFSPEEEDEIQEIIDSK